MITANPVLHSRRKHFGTYFHFVKDKVKRGEIKVIQPRHKFINQTFIYQSLPSFLTQTHGDNYRYSIFEGM